MTVNLVNKTRRMKVFNLPHEIFCKSLGKCQCKRSSKHPIPMSLTIPAGQSIDGLAEPVVQIPEIARAVKRGELEVKEVKPSTNKKRSEKAAETEKDKKQKADS